ncbi:MAG TPA: c-type cytochrome domain-containing protein [Planctomycetaceae bacterium]|nr:c-type cytochrome domain-containing protein [Planctomycetaceae bacterium]
MFALRNSGRQWLWCSAVAAMMIAAGMTARAEDAKPAEKVNFQDHVLPIFRAKCGSCHSAGQAKGGLVLESFSASIQGGASGAVVEPGDLDGSRLWALVTHKEQPAMPPKEPKLPDEMLAVIQKWIEQGALENKDSQPKIKKKAQFTLSATSASADKPAGPPPMPENLPTEPIVVSPRGNAVTALATSPWAPLAAVAGHKQVLLYNLEDQTLAGVLPFPEGTIHVLRFSRNGTLLLAGGGRGGQSGRVVVYDVKTGSRVFEIGAEADVVLAADISPDHSQIALGGPKKMVRVYSTTDGEQMAEMKKHTDWITAIEFSPDGVLLATGDRSNGLVVWEAYTGREYFVLNGHGSAVTGVSWRIDSNVLASTSEDTTIRLWEMNNGTQIKAWGAHGGGSAAVWFLRDGRLVSTGRDRVSKLWDQEGKQILAFPALGDLGLKVAYADTNNLALAGDWSGAVRVFDGKDAADKGTLPTNPAPLSARLDAAQKAAATAQVAAEQTAAQAAALQKAAADKKLTAETATRAATDAQGVLTTAQAAKTDADKLAAAAVESLKAADVALANANAAVEKAKQERDAAEKAGDKTALAARTAVFQDVEKSAAGVKQAREAIAQAQGAAEKVAADAAGRLKTAGDLAVAAKAAADKATAEANPTPEMTKAIEQAVAAARQAAESAALRKAVVEKLTNEKNRPAPSLVATPAQ